MIYCVPMRLLISILTSLLLAGTLSAESGQKLEWNSLSRGMELAKKQHRMIYVQVVTEWCGYCRKLQTEDYKKAAVRELLSRYVLVSIDGDHQADVANRFNVQGYPTLLVLSPSGELLARMDGYPGTDRLKHVLTTVLEKNKMAEGSETTAHPIARAQNEMKSGEFQNSVRILDAFIAGSEFQNSELALARFYRGLSLFELGDERARDDLLYASRRAPLPEQREKARNLLESIQE